MVESLEASRSWFTPALLPYVLWIVLFIGLGLFIETIIFARLRLWAAGTTWKVDSVLLQALQGMPVLWMTLTGLALFLDDLFPYPRLLLVEGFVRTLLIIASVTLVIMRMATGYVSYSASDANNISSVSILNNVIRWIIAALGLMVALQLMGVSITPLLGIVAGSSVGLTLALQQPLSNLFSGVMLVVSNKVRPGNYIRLSSGEEGYVTDVRWHTTFVRQLTNNMVSIPNAAMVSSMMTNFDDPQREMSILIDVGVSYDSDLEHVERVTMEVGNETMHEVEGGVPEFDTFIRYNNLDDFSINFTVILRGQDFVSQYLIKHEFIKRLVKRYRQEGIIIPFPIRTLHTSPDHPVGIDARAGSNGKQDTTRPPTPAELTPEQAESSQHVRPDEPAR